MTGLEVSGLIFALVFGVSALVLCIIRTALQPRDAVGWFGLGSLVVITLLVSIGAATEWGGCIKPEAEALVCENSVTPVAEWRPACRARPSSARVGAECRGATEKYAYCERISAATIAQPVNTATGLAFVTAAAAMLLLIPTTSSGRNPMAYPTFYSVGYAATVFFVGYGTVALHASFRDWGGVLDSFSIHTWLLFAICYRVARWSMWLRNPHAPATIVVFLIVWLALCSLALVLGVVVAEARLWLSVGLGGVWLVLEVICYFVSLQGRGHPGYWLFSTIAVFGAALLMKVLSDMTRLICDPDYVVQPHGLWHIFAASTALLAFVHFKEEPTQLG